MLVELMIVDLHMGKLYTWVTISSLGGLRINNWLISKV